jgi:SAM-dependent methyltransferase
VNRANWDERVPAHVASPDYAVARFHEEPAFLSGVVAFDRPLLGDLTGVQGVHLQCHIGTDTVSLCRLGARMTGLDFSGPAVEAARRLAEATGADATFVQGLVDEAPDLLGSHRFDLVYTGIGALCWLPRIATWAAVVAALIKPGGRLFVREGHPMLWSIDDELAGPEVAVRFDYFEHDEPLVYESTGSYVATDTEFEATTSASWNHGLGEIVSALLSEGFTLTGLAEHDSVPWNALPGRMTRDDAGEWRLADRPRRLAASFTLQAVKA